MEERQYGHKKMIVWQMADRLDVLIQKVLDKIPKYEFKLREQLDSATDSVGSNFVEGYYANSLPEYIKFCGYSLLVLIALLPCCPNSLECLVCL